MGDGELGTELSLLPKNRSGSGEVDSAGAFLDIPSTQAGISEDFCELVVGKLMYLFTARSVHGYFTFQAWSSNRIFINLLLEW